MPKLTLTSQQVTQLNEWLFGGPTDPIGLIAWLEANSATSDPAVVYQAEGERDLYQFLLASNGSNIQRNDLTPKMADALQWVAGSLDNWEALGFTIEDHQQLMRVVWNWVKNL